MLARQASDAVYQRYDRHDSACTGAPAARRQRCGAQLRRDLQAVAAGNGPGRAGAAQARAVRGEVSSHWRQAQGHPPVREWLVAQVAPLVAEVRIVLAAGLRVCDPKLPSRSRQLLKRWPAWWTFVTAVGVGPTRDRAEPALRPAVVGRKGSCGAQSDDGAPFVERMRAIAATCKQPGRALLD